MQEINLLQNKSQSEGHFNIQYRSQSPVFFYIVLTLLLVESGFYGFLFFSQKKVSAQMLEVEQRAADIEFEVTQIDKGRLEAISVQSRLKNLDVLLASHLFWSKVFGELESKTYKKVSFQSLQMDQISNRIVLTGFAPTQTDIAKFMVGLKTSPSIQTVNLKTSKAQQGEESGFTFNIDVFFDSKLLKK
ncbi:MAG: PilN domain-containing protein [bacterium]|nr:PilN domain-containing protein [bacterium]